MSNYEELRYLTDVANDPALENAKRRFKKGIKKLNNKLKKKLKKGVRKSSEFQIKKVWQMDFSRDCFHLSGKMVGELTAAVWG